MNEQQTQQDEVIIETRDLSRVYPGVVALDSVNYRVYRNQVNVLIGENGAGKSTMMKMLAGVETPSSGEILLDGQKVTLGSTHQAEKHGISIIFHGIDTGIILAGQQDDAEIVAGDRLLVTSSAVLLNDEVALVL